MLFRLDRGSDDATSLPPGWHGGELGAALPSFSTGHSLFLARAGGCGDKDPCDLERHTAQPSNV